MRLNLVLGMPFADDLTHLEITGEYREKKEEAVLPRLEETSLIIF